MTAEDSLDVFRRGRDAVVRLLVRTVAMRVLTVVGMVVLARILSPADFGVYAVLLAVALTLGVVADSGVAASLVQQRHEPEATEVSTAWVLQQAFAIPLTAAVWLAAPAVAASVPLGPDFESQLRVTALAIPLSVLRTVPVAMLTRVLRFGELAAIEVVMHLAFYASAVAGALLGAGSWSFVAAILAQSATGAVLANLAWRRWSPSRPSVAVGRRQLGFGLAYMAANLLVHARDAAVAIFGGLGGGVAAVGQLQLSFRIGQLVGTVDEIIARVTFPAFSRLQGDRVGAERLLRRAVVITALVVGGPVGWVAAAADPLVPVVFGDQWAPAVPIVRLVCLGTLAAVPMRFVRTLLFGEGRSRIGLILSFLTTLTMFVLFPTLLVALGLPGGGLAFAITSVVGLVLHVQAAASAVPFPWRDLARICALVAIASAASWAVVTVIPSVVGLVASAAVFAAGYAGLVLVFAREDLVLALRWLRGGVRGDPAAA